MEKSTNNTIVITPNIRKPQHLQSGLLAIDTSTINSAHYIVYMKPWNFPLLCRQEGAVSKKKRKNHIRAHLCVSKGQHLILHGVLII